MGDSPVPNQQVDPHPLAELSVPNALDRSTYCICGVVLVITMETNFMRGPEYVVRKPVPKGITVDLPDCLA